jgi:hypothetical protein
VRQATSWKGKSFSGGISGMEGFTHAQDAQDMSFDKEAIRKKLQCC